MTLQDIRDKAWVNHEDLLAVNFIRNPAKYRFRLHHRQGLRSLIFEVLRPEDLEQERDGIVMDGVRRYPAAVPLKMFRIFRAGFSSMEKAISEIRRIQVVLKYLTSHHMAVSQEMILSCRIGDRYELVLCGLQHFITGEPLDVWGQLPQTSPEVAESFIQRVKSMAHETRLIPDLAGIGNLILTPGGGLVLVDINNISSTIMDGEIRLDDKRYPVCDKSVEALSILESRLLHRGIDRTEPLYAHFLTPGRRRRVENSIRSKV